MYAQLIFIVLTAASTSHGIPSKCDLKPPGAKDPIPSDEKHPFRIGIENAEQKEGKIIFTAEQTYVLSLTSIDPSRTFRWFMIVAEDPDMDNNPNTGQKARQVGSLKTLDILQSRHSERCVNAVENFDNSEKERVDVHWVSPRLTERVRIRAMVAENEEVWYEGEHLNITLVKEVRPARDSSPYPATDKCNLCSEARYEVIFNGKWSRVAHPRHYPTKPDENGYTHMLGASHDYNFLLWKPSTKAREGLKVLLEDANTTALEREIIDEMRVDGGTRTLIRGKRRHHPFMFEPSHSLFRVDRVHHLFSIVVGMRPSPDWFLGMTQFELCVNGEWLAESNVSLFPWDAGTRAGVSYESETVPTQDNIERVEVGSFNKESPFYQLNLNDLRAFAILTVRRLDVYPLDESECGDVTETPDGENIDEDEEPSDEPQAYPIVSESRQKLDSRCYRSEWGEWSPCAPDVGGCGIGAQTRTRFYYANEDIEVGSSVGSSCALNEDENLQIQHCFVEC